MARLFSMATGRTQASPAAAAQTVTERAELARIKDERAERLNRRLTVVLCRLAGFMLFGLGAVYWVRIVGIHEGALWRFDLMPVAWKVSVASLAVLYPVAGVGLWMTASWGAVIWAIIVLAESLMHLALPYIFGEPGLFLFLNAFGFLMLIVLRLVGWWEARHRLSRGLSHAARPGADKAS